MIMDEFAYDEDVFAKINLDIKLAKNKYYGILRCSTCFPIRLHWKDAHITDHINIKTHVLRVEDVSKLVDKLPTFHPDRLYVIHFECDTRCYYRSDGEVNPKNLIYLQNILKEVSSNMSKLWGSNTNMLFVLSTPMYKEALETRFFKWLHQHSPGHCYRLYEVRKTGV